MKSTSPPSSHPPAGLEAEVAEERRLWEAIHDPGLKATARVTAYARWRAALQRLRELGHNPGPRDEQDQRPSASDPSDTPRASREQKGTK